MAETQPQLQPALLRLSATVSQDFIQFCLWLDRLIRRLSRALWEALRTSLAVSGGRCAKAMRATSSAICRFRLSCSAPAWPICSPKKAPTRVPVTLSAREANIDAAAQSGYRIRLNSSGGQTCPDYCGY